MKGIINKTSAELSEMSYNEIWRLAQEADHRIAYLSGKLDRMKDNGYQPSDDSDFRKDGHYLLYLSWFLGYQDQDTELMNKDN